MYLQQSRTVKRMDKTIKNKKNRWIFDHIQPKYMPPPSA